MSTDEPAGPATTQKYLGTRDLAILPALQQAARNERADTLADR